MQAMALLTALLVPAQKSEAIEPQYPIESTFLSADARLWWEEQATDTPEIATTTSIHLTTSAEEDSFIKCSCISFVRKLSQFQPPVVKQAIDIPIKWQIAIPGAWVLFRAGPIYSRYGHAAYVKSVGTSTIFIIEKNFKKCAITTREIEKRDSNIRGYYY